VEEWLGKTSDAKVPAHVRLRIFDRHNGVCHLTGRKIRVGEPWDLDHIVALVNGGEHRETNLAPALRDKHREKTAADLADKSKVYETRAKHLGAETAQGPRSQTTTRPRLRLVSPEICEARDMKFRKKPVEIEAWQFKAPNFMGQPDWFVAAMNLGKITFVAGEKTHYRIQTLEGVMRANPGDWIIRGVKGELYPCKPDIFAATYEAVSA
jgi:hypothetical protein